MTVEEVGPELNALTERVIGAGITVHRTLGPGLLESTYCACLGAELEALAVPFQREVPLRVRYRNVFLDCGYRIDFLVDGRLVVEVKSVSKLDSVFIAQTLTYLKLSGCQLGLLMNFNVPLLRDGIRRVILSHGDWTSFRRKGTPHRESSADSGLRGEAPRPKGIA